MVSSLLLFFYYRLFHPDMRDSFIFLFESCVIGFIFITLRVFVYARMWDCGLYALLDELTSYNLVQIRCLEVKKKCAGEWLLILTSHHNLHLQFFFLFTFLDLQLVSTQNILWSPYILVGLVWMLVVVFCRRKKY